MAKVEDFTSMVCIRLYPVFVLATAPQKANFFSLASNYLPSCSSLNAVVSIRICRTGTSAVQFTCHICFQVSTTPFERKIMKYTDIAHTLQHEFT